MLTYSQPLKSVFYCPEESDFYSHCIELILQVCSKSEVIVEFGSGDATPVINAICKTEFQGIIHGFELNNSASEIAKANIRAYKCSDNYVIHNTSFFDSFVPKSKYLISNPPYLPAIDNKIYQPLLHGGNDGSTISKKLLSLDYENVLLMVSSYSNPQGLIEYAVSKGYFVKDFLVSPLKFGYYSSESKVENTISQLRKQHQAFYSDNIYLLAGVMFTQDNSGVDLSTELIQLMTCL